MPMNTRKNWMRFVLSAALCAGATLSFSPHASATHAQQAVVKGKARVWQRHLKIDGNGEVTVNPDSLRTRVAVTTQASTLAGATAEAAVKTRGVIAALQRLGIRALKVRTVALEIEPITKKTKAGESTGPGSIVGYRATSTLSIALMDVSVRELREQGARIVNTALASGANVVGGVSFFLNNPHEARRMALGLAVEDAKRNAKAMAKKANLVIVGVHSISGARSYGGPYLAAQAALGGGAKVETEAPAAGGFPIEPGDIVVTADVEAEFLFVRR